MKVAYNACFGGFGLSEVGQLVYKNLGGTSEDPERTDPILIHTIEKLGDAASGEYARLKIRDVPPGSLWRIETYDGNERVMLQSEYNWQLA